MNVPHILFFLGVITSIAAKIEENGIVGDPIVDCGDSYVEVRFETQNTFKGLVFVEDYLTDPDCRSPAAENVEENGRNASLRLGFKGCGVERRHSQNPKGIFVVASLIVAFHPEFLTKIDRIYIVQCFYMEMEKIVEKEIQVKLKPPLVQTESVPMPVCRYEVLDGSPNGPPIFYAVIGQQVYHKWTCETETENQFCMIVHSCFVDDGNGDRVQLIDENGCAKDRHLLQNLEYVSDLMVGQEAHVYKYADRQQMFFDCQITLTIKEPNQQLCDVPVCPEPSRQRRSSKNQQNETEDSEIRQDVSGNLILAQNFTDSLDLETSYIIRSEQIQRPGWLDSNFETVSASICMTTLGLSSVAVLNFFMISTSVLFFYNAYRHICLNKSVSENRQS